MVVSGGWWSEVGVARTSSIPATAQHDDERLEVGTTNIIGTCGANDYDDDDYYYDDDICNTTTTVVGRKVVYSPPPSLQ